MKKIALFCITSILFTACKNDLNIAADYEEVPVAYGELSVSDSLHYIRIQKAYLSNSRSALEIAKEKDSIYYQNLKVEISDANNPSIKYTLNKIDGNTIGIPKDSGIFYNSENILYSFNAKNLSATKNYKLNITNPVTAKTLSGTTNMIGNFDMIRPLYGVGPQTPFLSFSKDINGVYSETLYKWFSPANAKLYKVDITASYYEWDINTPGNKTLKNFTWTAVNNLTHNNTVAEEIIEAKLSGSDFLYAIASLPKASSTTIRQLNQALTIKIKAYNETYANYNEIKIAQSGLTSEEALPRYTNLTGGYGVFFSSYVKTINYVLLSTTSMDLAACDPISKSQRFLNGSGSLCQ